MCLRYVLEAVKKRGPSETFLTASSLAQYNITVLMRGLEFTMSARAVLYLPQLP